MRGRVWKFGDNIDTDIIIPARYLAYTDPQVLGQHCMEPLAPDFAKTVQKGDIIVAGSNFGCGSSREHAPIAILALGIPVVIARSFARIFYRNSFNKALALPRGGHLRRRERWRDHRGRPGNGYNKNCAGKRAG